MRAWVLLNSSSLCATFQWESNLYKKRQERQSTCYTHMPACSSSSSTLLLSNQAWDLVGIRSNGGTWGCLGEGKEKHGDDGSGPSGEFACCSTWVLLYWANHLVDWRGELLLPGLPLILVCCHISAFCISPTDRGRSVCVSLCVHVCACFSECKWEAPDLPHVVLITSADIINESCNRQMSEMLLEH